MGYLDSDTITVDAILTSNGRKKLAEGQTLGISKFALSDDGIDYSLWNADHPSGSANYADAITKLPQTEAVPSDGVVMRYLLVTMDRNTVFMPEIIGIQESYTITNQQDVATIAPQTNNGSDNQYKFHFDDISAWNVTGGTITYLGGATGGNRLTQNEIPSPADVIASEIKVKAAATNVTRRAEVSITGMQTGATATTKITAQNNIPTLKQN